MRASVLALLAKLAGAPLHHGAFIDPHHYVGTSSFAGMRFIDEVPIHTLAMMGTDDGTVWWNITGGCAGANMDQLTFDFTSKGGPPNLHGVAVDLPNGASEIRWEDGNVWTSIAAPDVLPASAHDQRAARKVARSQGLTPELA